MFRLEECLLLAFLPWEIRLTKGNLEPKQRANWQRCTYPLRNRWIKSALALVANEVRENFCFECFSFKNLITEV